MEQLKLLALTFGMLVLIGVVCSTYLAIPFQMLRRSGIPRLTRWMLRKSGRFVHALFQGVAGLLRAVARVIRFLMTRRRYRIRRPLPQPFVRLFK